jgi:hypothetical protein
MNEPSQRGRFPRNLKGGFLTNHATSVALLMTWPVADPDPSDGSAGAAAIFRGFRWEHIIIITETKASVRQTLTE